MSLLNSPQGASAADGPMTSPASPVKCKVILVLPAYNEGPNLGSLFSAARRSMVGAGLCYEVVVVNDGSSDATPEVLRKCKREYPITVVEHERNCGLAQTMRDGLVEASRRATSADIVVTMDADGTHTPSVILKMVELIEGGCDVVVASRFRPGATVRGVPVYRQVLAGRV
jgi:dolichol-phosphate mannosyltransferase